MTTNPAPVVEVVGLAKSYGAKTVLTDVSLDVREGEIVGVVGPNGAGKTTTVECVAGLRAADAGEVSVLGLHPLRDRDAVRRLVGVQLQETQLHDRVTVAEALDLFASFYPEPGDVRALTTELGLDEHRGTRWKRLSGGLKQRLSIALALVGSPRLVILDELTTGLDPHARREAWSLVRRIRDRGVTVLLVTHFMDEVEQLCDRVHVIDDGRVVASGTPDEIRAGVDGARTFEDAYVALTTDRRAA